MKEKLPDADAVREDELQYGTTPASRQEVEEKHPNRPRNHSRTLVFSTLFLDVFNPMIESRMLSAKKSGPRNRGSRGVPDGPSYQEKRRHIIERYITRWRKEVGDDFYPAMRLMMPGKDRDRGLYGLKENTIGKLLVKLMKIDKKSDDGYALLNWKMPGQTMAARLAGDFAGRCYEVLSKRPMRLTAGDMTIAEVNQQLDELAAAAGEAESLSVLERFYQRMNAEELMWIIRIILGHMRIGASEKMLLYLWHPDAEALFSVSSSLRRVCWELFDPEKRLDSDIVGLTLMQCFQPQLAQFPMPTSFERMIQLLHPTDDDAEFWIEEKLDGERMQMHLSEDSEHPGRRSFGFWSRNGKKYNYLYGDGSQDGDSSLTRHLGDAFAPGVRNLILDGEMITWDMGIDKMVPFGSLKTAAVMERQNNSESDSAGLRPLFRVFDILYLNDKQLTQYTLRDRRRALERAVRSVHRRLEVHTYTIATGPETIEPLLRDVVANASEGLVLKNPRSMYRLNSRNDDWLKVKPEYMSGFGESLDCLIIGGYYGSGRRGGMLSSFLCGLRATRNHIRAGANPEKCFSFFKVGGGLRAEDYAAIRHRTEGKWREWDAKNPPRDYIELGGSGEGKQHERPDMWIRPSDSVVISVKASSVCPSDKFARGFTLRFPRFRQLRADRSWDSALSVDEFQEFRKRAEEEQAGTEGEMRMEKRRRGGERKRIKTSEVTVVGQGVSSTWPTEGGQASDVFDGLSFCVLSESLKPYKKTKAEIEAVIKDHGGRILQRATTDSGMILMADKKVIKVASLIKQGGEVDLIRPRWIRDCLEQSGGPFRLPYEECHLLEATERVRTAAKGNVDKYGDSFARDVSVNELRETTQGMTIEYEKGEKASQAAGFLQELEERGQEFEGQRGLLFRRCVVQFGDDGDGDAGRWADADRLGLYVRYGGGNTVGKDGEEGNEERAITHIVMTGGETEQMRARAMAKARGKRSEEGGSEGSEVEVVTGKWVEDCWRERKLLDEGPYRWRP